MADTDGSASTFLIGGGWTESARTTVYGPFLQACPAHPTVACVVFDEGDGSEQFRRWATVLTEVGRCRPEPVLLAPESVLSVADLAGADALLICGGLTPGYAQVLAPAAADLRAWLVAGGRPYAGFSAGSAVAATRAVVGGWRRAGLPVCPEDAGEDLEEVTVTDGLGLVPFAVDVHAAQWGTVTRLISAVGAGLVSAGVAIDEDTVLIGGSLVAGSGQAWSVRREVGSPGSGPAGAADRADAVRVERIAAGGRVPPDLR